MYVFFPDGQYKALILEFSLKPSVYATMALRELLKCETSATHHATLTMKQSKTIEEMEKQQETENNKPKEMTDTDNSTLNDNKTEVDINNSTLKNDEKTEVKTDNNMLNDDKTGID